MPNPNLKRSLKAGKGGKRPHAGRPTAAAVNRIRKKARALLESPEHQKVLKQKMDDMTINPSIYVAYLYYAYDKPKESVEVKQLVPVRIVHEYDTTPKPDPKKDADSDS